MHTWLITLIALISTGICMFLWFRDVRRIMRERKNMMESADRQLTACRKKALRDRADPETAAVLARSESIYRQAVDIYNRTLKKPWCCLPAHLMGFHHIS